MFKISKNSKLNFLKIILLYVGRKLKNASVAGDLSLATSEQKKIFEFSENSKRQCFIIFRKFKAEFSEFSESLENSENSR